LAYEIIITVIYVDVHIPKIKNLSHGFHPILSRGLTIPKLRVYFVTIHLVKILKAEMIWGGERGNAELKLLSP
jgi:hypothetical protein